MDPDYVLFARIVEAGSLSGAARAMALSPAMVSKRLARLERRLGVTLVHRTTRSLSLTEVGARFHADVEAILRDVAAAEARLRGERGTPSGPLRLSAPTSFGRLHIAPYLGRFLDAHPQVDVELNLTDEFVDLAANRTDLAIRIAPQVEPSLVARRLASSRRILCAAPAYVERFGAPESIEDLRAHRLLAASGQMPWRLSDSEGQPVSVDAPSHVRTNSSEVARELAIAGVGIALRSLWDIDQELADGRLVQVLAAFEGSADVGIWAVSPRLPWPSINAEAFARFLEGLYSPPPWE